MSIATLIRLTRKELAARLRLKPNTLAHWAVTGKGPKYIVINGRVRYDLADVEAWEGTTHQSTAEYDTSTRAANMQKAQAARTPCPL